MDRKGDFVEDLSEPTQQAEGRAQTPSGKQLFQLVKDLIQQRPFSPEGVARLTGVQLFRDPTLSNDYFTIYQSAEDAEQAPLAVEIRIPTAVSDKKDGMVLLYLSPPACVSPEEVMNHFGREPEVGVDPPELGGFYYRYPFPWGELRFGFRSRGKADCLTMVAIAAIMKKLPEK